MNCKFPPRPLYSVPLAHGRVLQLGDRPLLMGVVNVTPDSFADRLPTPDPAAAVDAVLRLEGEGADLVDIGGESTRPGADPVTEQEELARVVPVVRAAARQTRLPISVDTSKPAVAQAALDEGAAIVNDVTGLRHDAALARVVAGRGAGLVLMHSRGGSKAMYAGAHYEDLVGEIAAELRWSIATALAAGVRADCLIVDPGVGFAKRPVHSYGVLAQLPALARLLDRPMLVGPSRKSFMREALGDRPAPERDWGTAAAVTAAVLAGAHVVRVHAVTEMRQVVQVAEEIRRQA